MLIPAAVAAAIASAGPMIVAAVAALGLGTVASAFS